MQKYYSVKIGTLDLIRSPIIAVLKRKNLYLALSQVNFVHSRKASEEEIGPLKEYCSFKEFMSSLYKENILSAIVKEIYNHTNLKY